MQVGHFEIYQTIGNLWGTDYYQAVKILHLAHAEAIPTTIEIFMHPYWLGEKVTVTYSGQSSPFINDDEFPAVVRLV